MNKRKTWRRGVLPGFGLTSGFTISHLSLVVLLPIAGLVVATAQLSWAEFWQAISGPRALAAYRMSFGGALLASLVNAGCGLLVAWVLVRYSFSGKAIADALVDLPLALPTAVAGIALTAIYSQRGWIGRFLEPLGVQVAYAPAGVLLAMIFVGLPFAVRTVQPVLQDLDRQAEEASATLGATALQTFRKVVLPTIAPAVATGFALAFARAVGEYGSIVFISGNLPQKTEIVPLLIMTKLDQFDYRGATALALVMLFGAFMMLLLLNGLQNWMRKGHHA